MTAFLDFISANAGVIGLVTFFSFFVLLLIWVLRPGSREKFRDHARIPLRENGSNRRSGNNTSDTLENKRD